MGKIERKAFSNLWASWKKGNKWSQDSQRKGNMKRLNVIKNWKYKVFICQVYLSSLYGSVCVFGQENVFSLFELLHDVKRPGEIYSMMTTEDLLVASIFSSNCEIDVIKKRMETWKLIV